MLAVEREPPVAAMAREVFAANRHALPDGVTLSVIEADSGALCPKHNPDPSRDPGPSPDHRPHKQADQEDLEDGRREVLETHISERSESGLKGVHKTGTGRWQTQVHLCVGRTLTLTLTLTPNLP